MNAREEYQSCEIERLRAEVAGLREENGKLREELIEARNPILDVPALVGVGVLCILAALQTCEWKSQSADISAKRSAVSAPARYRGRSRQKHGMTGSMSGPQSPARTTGPKARTANSNGCAPRWRPFAASSAGSNATGRLPGTGAAAQTAGRHPDRRAAFFCGRISAFSKLSGRRSGASA